MSKQENSNMWRKNSFFVVASALALVMTGAAAQGADWGTLSGRFVLDKKPAAPKPLQITKDQEVCAKNPLVDESVVAGPNGELANVYVYLRTKKPRVHPDYEKSAKDTISLDNQKCRYEPHAAVLRTTQTLELKNSDPIGHNVKGDCLINSPFNVIVPANGSSPITTLTKEESLPVKVGCNIHPWMGGWLLIRDNPYGVASGADGTFTIKDLPAGEELEFQFWQESKGNLKNLSFQGGKSDAKGRFKLKLKAGENDLGEIKVSL